MRSNSGKATERSSAVVLFAYYSGKHHPAQRLDNPNHSLGIPTAVMLQLVRTRWRSAARATCLGCRLLMVIGVVGPGSGAALATVT